MIRRLSYLNSMSDIANKKYQILVHTITFNIIFFQSAGIKESGGSFSDNYYYS